MSLAVRIRDSPQAREDWVAMAGAANNVPPRLARTRNSLATSPNGACMYMTQRLPLASAATPAASATASASIYPATRTTAAPAATTVQLAPRASSEPAAGCTAPPATPAPTAAPTRPMRRMHPPGRRSATTGRTDAARARSRSATATTASTACSRRTPSIAAPSPIARIRKPRAPGCARRWGALGPIRIHAPRLIHSRS